MRVRIYKPAASSMQSAPEFHKSWRIEPEYTTPRYPESLMGWAGAGDSQATMQARLRFESFEEACSFARRRGWDYYVERPNERRSVPRSYLDNFNPDRRRDGR